MDKPTEAQKKEFLEYFGFTLRCPPEKDAYKRGSWNYPDGLIGDVDLDLNNLFKYPVPRLQDGTFISIDFTPPFNDKEKWLCSLGYSRIAFESINAEGTTSALALFWAIYSIIDPTPKV